ncbi:MAG: hypothetical protein RL432_1510 [Bacteroidota bacterium]|jgi:uncharacterized integral membrane protein (TIGR00698 family)
MNQEKLLSVIWVVGISAAAWLIAPYSPSALNSIMLALLLGIILGTLIKFRQEVKKPAGTIGSKALEYSILFLAFGINYRFLVNIGWIPILGIISSITAVLLVTKILVKRFNCPASAGWLIGIGTAICGSSAIAAAAPFVSKNKEDIGISLAVINLWGALGMILLPVILHLPFFDSINQGLMIGGGLHSVGNVMGAAYGISDALGNEALAIKMARVALLTPALLVIVAMNRREYQESNRVKVKIPWYIYGFLFITAFVSIFKIPSELIEWNEWFGKISLTVAMAAIGMNVNLKELLISGRKGLVFGLLIFIAQLAVLFVAASV